LSGWIELWRIAADTPDYEAIDLSGKGAEITGGRWNRKGTPIVYASSSRALSCLESVVHVSGSIPLPLNRYLVKIQIPISAWNSRATFVREDQVGWDAEPAGKVSIDWGTSWAAGKATLIAAVPSIIVPEELNVLLNPNHADISKVKATKIRKWTFDHRIKI
jgi:RES domain-containing protein